ncbi:unnamed protein product [Lymnaea stagnalis]|uniref:Hexosyltransferase n=1 Tax=Lymnaea stagnalis TaxID=6523 RepID=A0AAV2HVA3_LYMST
MRTFACKRVFLKGFPVLTFFAIVSLYAMQRSVYFKPSRLADTLQALQDTQKLNTKLSLRARNISLSQAASTIGSRKRSEGAALEKTTRGWFDKRPNVTASKLNPADHPHFRGFAIENPGVCTNETVDVLIYFHSAVDHRNERRVIRETWASSQTFSDISVKRIFILGRTEDKLRQLQIETEQSAYGDLVQGNFVDAFSNLTHKALTLLVWVNAHCPQARYVAKADDDMFVDIYRVVKELVPQLASVPSGAACDHKTDMDIIRSPGSKWCVDKSLLAGRSKWPPFCPGYFTLFTGSTVPKLYEASFSVRDFVPTDDAYLFGLLPERNVTLEIVNIHGVISPNVRANPEEELKVQGKLEYLAFRANNAAEQTKIWSARSKKLTSWEQAHSFYHNALKAAGEKGVLVL